jgi:hypothetical protein
MPYELLEAMYVRCWYVSSDTHFQNIASLYIYLQNVVYELIIHMADKLDFISSAITVIPYLCYVTFSYTFLQKECERFYL